MDIRPIEPPRTARGHKARKNYHCDGADDISWAHGCQGIRKGDLYVRAVAFPGEAGNEDGSGPLAMRLCRDCASGYDNTMAVLP